MKVSTIVLIVGGLVIGYMSLKLLVVALVVFTAYMLTQKYELFSEDTRFLSKSEFERVLDEDKDGFLGGLTEMDLYARRASSRQDYLERAKRLTSDFTAGEKSRILNIIKTIQSKDLSHFGIDSIKWDKLKLIFAKSEYEDGYPHTRGDIIVLNDNTLSRSDSDLRNTIIHEKVHIYQKAYPHDIRAFLDGAGFTIADHRKSYRLARANPDLDQFVYKSRDGTIHMSEYRSDKPSGIWDITGTSDGEHPLEMMAYRIANEY